MAVRIQFRRDTTANWASVNPILAPGEIGIDTEIRLFKIGDGFTAWNDLEFIRTELQLATEQEAQEGTNNVVYMTPLRTAQLIDAFIGDIDAVLTQLLGEEPAGGEL